MTTWATECKSFSRQPCPHLKDQQWRDWQTQCSWSMLVVTLHSFVQEKFRVPQPHAQKKHSLTQTAKLFWPLRLAASIAYSLLIRLWGKDKQNNPTKYNYAIPAKTKQKNLLHVPRTLPRIYLKGWLTPKSALIKLVDAALCTRDWNCQSVTDFLQDTLSEHQPLRAQTLTHLVSVQGSCWEWSKEVLSLSCLCK